MKKGYRRCKYCIREAWLDDDKNLCTSVYCIKGLYVYRLAGCTMDDCYTPVNVDPYWKDIIDETNRRLNGLSQRK